MLITIPAPVSVTPTPAGKLPRASLDIPLRVRFKL
jgi:hypothetical protein